MKIVKRVILLFALFFIPILAFAGPFDVPATDKSMQYLGKIFGTVGSLPLQGGGNPIFSQMVYIFNQIVFALAIVIIIVTTVIGTINTAQEGETLGKKMSSIWIPARAGFGMYLLLPSVGGYNWIQVIVMWLIVQGVGAANALWAQAIQSNEVGGSQVSDTRLADVKNSITAVANIFKSVVCMQAVNNAIIADTTVANGLNDGFISPITSSDGGAVNFSRTNAPANEAPLCGTVKIPDVGANPITGSVNANDPVVQGRRQAFIDAIMSAEQALEPAAAEALANPNPTAWNYSSSWVSAARVLQGAAQAATLTTSDFSDVNKQALLDGWIHAGNYYFQLVATGSYIPPAVSLAYNQPNTGTMSELIGPTKATPIIASINNIGGGTNSPGAYQSYVLTDPNMQAFAPSQSAGGSLVPINVAAQTGDIGNVFNAIFGSSFFSDLAASLGNHITSGCLSNSADPNSQLGDPVTCMASFGATLTSTAETVFWSALIAIFLVFLGTSIMCCMQPLCMAVDFLLAVIIPVASSILMILWTAGISMALYIPLIPLLVFTFSAMGWVILVIEAVLGAPLIALTLIIPSEDEIGKAGHAIVILLGLFLRPALMILGFIFAQKMIMVAIGMLNFGFAGTLAMSMGGGIGLFGFCCVIMLYAGIAVSLVHEAFSLIYLLPDKVLRWMGEHGESSEAGHLAKEAEGSMGAGQEVGKKLMGGSLQMASGK
jgi:conjugal transfer/type IV secretion protein DotA/TraY